MKGFSHIVLESTVDLAAKAMPPEEDPRVDECVKTIRRYLDLGESSPNSEYKQELRPVVSAAWPLHRVFYRKGPVTRPEGLGSGIVRTFGKRARCGARLALTTGEALACIRNWATIHPNPSTGELSSRIRRLEDLPRAAWPSPQDPPSIPKQCAKNLSCGAAYRYPQDRQASALPKSNRAKSNK